MSSKFCKKSIVQFILFRFFHYKITSIYYLFSTIYTIFCYFRNSLTILYCDIYLLIVTISKTLHTIFGYSIDDYGIFQINLILISPASVFRVRLPQTVMCIIYSRVIKQLCIIVNKLKTHITY